MGKQNHLTTYASFEMLPIRIAAAQYSCDKGNLVDDQDKTIHITDDAMHFSDLVLLPESSFVENWAAEYVRERSTTLYGPVTAILAQCAVVRNSYVCFNIAEREGEHFYNTTILLRPDGKIAGSHRKFRLSETDAQAGFTPGEKPTVIETSIGRIGILTGLEVLDKQCIHALVAQGAQLIISPSIVTADSREEIHNEVVNWSKRLSKLATIARSHVLWANKCGLAAGKVAIGSSMIVDPHGKILARGKIDQDEIVRSTVTLTASPLYANIVDRT